MHALDEVCGLKNVLAIHQVKPGRHSSQAFNQTALLYPKITLRPISGPIAGQVCPQQPTLAAIRRPDAALPLTYRSRPPNIQHKGKLRLSKAQIAPGLFDFRRGHPITCFVNQSLKPISDP